MPEIGELTLRVKADFSELANELREMADRISPPESSGPLPARKRRLMYRPEDDAVAVFTAKPYKGALPFWVVVFSDGSQCKEREDFFDDRWVPIH